MMESYGGFAKRHPDNPRYFLFRGEPLALITAGEHYGAVLNLDFDFVRYLDALRELQNTLAPTPGSYLAPWRHGDVPGGYDGGRKFDLEAPNDECFRRLAVGAFWPLTKPFQGSRPGTGRWILRPAAGKPGPIS